MSGDVDTMRKALAFYLAGQGDNGVSYRRALAALDRLAAVEAQRDDLVEAMEKITHVHNGAAARVMAHAALAAVAPTEASA